MVRLSDSIRWIARENSNPIDIHLSTFVDGEYTRTLVAATKGDVYSFGIVKCATDLQREFGGLDNLPVKQLYTTGCQRSLIGKDNNAELLQCMKFACSCVISSPKERPTVFEVYQLLRAVGEKYHFSAADDELTMQPQNANPEDDLIVAN